MIKETRRTHHSTIAPGKPIKERYKLFAIGDEGYLYNYSWYSPAQGLEGRSKVKNLGDTVSLGYKELNIPLVVIVKTRYSLRWDCARPDIV